MEHVHHDHCCEQKDHTSPAPGAHQQLGHLCCTGRCMHPEHQAIHQLLSEASEFRLDQQSQTPEVTKKDKQTKKRKVKAGGFLSQLLSSSSQGTAHRLVKGT